MNIWQNNLISVSIKQSSAQTWLNRVRNNFKSECLINVLCCTINLYMRVGKMQEVFMTSTTLYRYYSSQAVLKAQTKNEIVQQKLRIVYTQLLLCLSLDENTFGQFL